MTHTYNVSGMTCNGCIAKVKSELFKIGDVTEVKVQLAAPQATISMQKHIPIGTLQASLQKAGDFTITEADEGMMHAADNTTTTSGLQTYKPILLIFFYVTVVSIIVGASADGFNWMLSMRVFMSGFFLTFSFFKMLDLNGFADNYSTYDIVAKRFRGWGYFYAFIELALGVAFALNFYPILTNAVTFVVMAVSIIGVLQSVLQKRKITCACLGAVFNLPMSTVTIVEDALMITMSGIMLIKLL